MKTFHDQILKPAVVEANATGMHIQKVKLEEDLRIKQEKEKLELERLKKEKEEKEVLQKKKLEQDALLQNVKGESVSNKAPNGTSVQLLVVQYYTFICVIIYLT